MKARVLDLKEPVRVRFKLLASGAKSIYFDYAINGKRTYQFLKLYINPENTTAAKAANRKTLELVKALKAEKVKEVEMINSGVLPSRIDSGKRITLKEYIEVYIKRISKPSNGLAPSTITTYNAFFQIALRYRNINVSLSNVDTNYCVNFIAHLKKQNLKDSTIRTYYNNFSSVMNAATKDKLILSNPLVGLKAKDKPSRATEESITYLTEEELRLFANTNCYDDVIKHAFMFCCYCGLRCSDAFALTYENIQVIDGVEHIVTTAQKTKKKTIIPLTEGARKWIYNPVNKNRDCRLFPSRSVQCISYTMRFWVQSTGIDKRITFHSSRHTFATLLLANGVDIYTISKLLGHSSISITEVYAKLMNKDRQTALNKLPVI